MCRNFFDVYDFSKYFYVGASFCFYTVNNFYLIHKVPLTLTLRQSLRWIYEEVMYGIYRAKVRTARRS
jgi:hypothetical protein